MIFPLRFPSKKCQNHCAQQRQDEEFDDLLEHLDALENARSASGPSGASSLVGKEEVTRRGLRHLAQALQEGAAGNKKKDTEES